MDANRRIQFWIVLVMGLVLSPWSAAWSQQIKVTSATPASTYQGTASLDVVIAGSGFDSTSKAQFFVTGTTNPGGITVKKTVFHNSKEVVATIDVADTADIASFDIVVALDSGRKGKGTTLFAVQSKSSDPCTTAGLDFPAFMYWVTSGSSRMLRLADASGVCSRDLLKTVAANGASFSYPIAGTQNVGRVLYIDSADQYVKYIDVTVDRANNTIVLAAPVALFSGVNLNIAELSTDGMTVYFSQSPGSPDGFSSIYGMTIGNSQSAQEIYRSQIAGAFFQLLSVSADGTTLVVLQTASLQNRDFVLRMTLPCNDFATCATVLKESTSSSVWPSVDATGTVVAYSDYLAGFNNCFQIRFLDSATGSSLFEGTQPRYGTASSWFGDQVLVNGRAPPDRKGTCSETGVVTRIDPATGAETPLLKGYGPDGR